MPDALLIGLFFKISGWIAKAVAKNAANAFSDDSPLERAIRSTSEVIQPIEGVDKSLRSWCGSDEFRRLSEGMQKGEGCVTDDSLLDSFLEVSHFYSGDETRKIAAQLLQVFAENLQDNLYTSDKGVSFLAHRQEKLHVETVSTVQGGVAQLISKVSRIEEILPYVISDDVGKLPKVQDKILHAKVDQARDLLLEGKSKTAESLLEKLRTEVGPSGSPELLFRIITNLGCCALQGDDTKTAAEHFRNALKYQPESAKAIGNASLASLISGEAEDALHLCTRARAIDPRDGNSTIVMIQALHALSREDELNSLLEKEKWIESDGACAWAIADVRMKQGDFRECERLLRKSLEQGCKHPNLLVSLSAAIFYPVHQKLLEETPLLWRIDKRMLEKTSDGEDLLTRAVEALEKHENRSYLHDALSNRAALRMILGNTGDALTDCDRVLSENKDHGPALQNKALILLKQGKFSEAAEHLELLLGRSDDKTFELLLARARSGEGSHRRVIELLRADWQPTPNDKRQLEISELLLTAYVTLGDEGNAAKVLQSIEETWANDPDAARIKAQYFRRARKYDKAIDVLRRATDLATPDARDRIAIELADIYSAMEEFAKAADTIESVVDKSSDNALTRNYLVYLHNSQRLRQALALAREIRSDGRPIPVISEIEALILESVGDLENASQLWQQLSEDYPEKANYRLSLARIDLRRGDRESARERILAVQYGEIKDDPDALVEVAQERAVLGISGVLPLIYRARRIDPGNPGIHLAYVALFPSREHLKELPPVHETVEAECVVHLKRNGEVRHVTITADDSPDSSKGEFGTSDALASRLIGLRKGDCVVLKNTPLEELSYQITDIQSKYVFAFQQTLDEFSTKFPDHPGFYRIEFKENDFSKIFMMIDKRHEFITQLTRLYQEKGLPLSTVAQVAGVPISDVWAGMIGTRTGKVIAAPGTQEARNAASEHLSHPTTIVVDLTALLTLGYLELLDRLPKRFEKLFVVQAVQDELSNTLLKSALGGRPSGTLGKQGDFYSHQEITPEQLEEGKKFLEHIRKFVERSTEVVPANTVLDIEQDRAASLKRILPHCALTSILVADERKNLLYSDDFGLRNLAKKEWNVNGVWTQAVLEDLRKHNFLTNEEYQKAMKNLLLANYFFVPITHETILEVLRESGMEVSREAQKLFEALHGPDCDENSAVQLASELIRQVWLEPILDYHRHVILDVTLNAVSTGRFSLRAILKLKYALASKFTLLPLQYKDVMQTIGLWERQNQARQGLVH